MSEPEQKLYYVETGVGACLQTATSKREARTKALKEVGTYNGVQLVREASTVDVAWVQAMGGARHD